MPSGTWYQNVKWADRKTVQVKFPNLKCEAFSIWSCRLKCCACNGSRGYAYDNVLWSSIPVVWILIH